MSYNCTLFKNTGFNTVNIPDSLTLLQSVGTPLQVPSLEIVQDRVLSSIRVHATWSQVEDTDYVLVNDFLYTVSGIKMLNGDTAELSLIPDYITSAGGVGVLSFIDGMTERVHVSDDEYGKYTEHDDFMAPAEPLEIEIYRYSPTSQDYQLVESTIDLEGTGAQSYNTALTYEDTQTGEMVTVPQNAPLTHYTDFKLNGRTHTNKTCVFDLSNTDVVNGIQKTRALGTESAIIAQYRIPMNYCIYNQGTSADVASLESDLAFTPSITLPFEYNTVQNEKVLYSDYTKYGMMSMSGDKAEFDPADIYDANTSPLIRVICDPRAGGKPYFRYNTYKGDASVDSFFTNCIAGAPWEQVPLVYTGNSGTELNRLQFEATYEYDYGKRERDIIKNVTAGAIGGTAGGYSQRNKVAIPSKINPKWSTTNEEWYGGSIMGVGGALLGTLVSAVGEVFNIFDFGEQSKLERMKFMTDNYVTAPQLQVPYNADMLRDSLGNGVICYRYKYSQNDIKRIDKILTMYGYKHTKPLEATDFTSRDDFNYVEARGVEVCAANGSRLPRWWCNGIAAQLEAGTRVWHVAPSPSHYTPQP